MRVLVIDIGGSNVKFRLGGGEGKWKRPSGVDLTPGRFSVLAAPVVAEACPEVVTIGFPSVVRDDEVVEEPENLGAGWVGFDLRGELGVPTRVINDAAMQALGVYEGRGRMLFLGLGTGLGSAIIDCGRVVPLELGRLRYSRGRTFEDVVGKRALKAAGRAAWERAVWEVVGILRESLLTESIALGGGNAKLLEEVPDGIRIGSNKDAVAGGVRLWRDGGIEIGASGRGCAGAREA